MAKDSIVKTIGEHKWFYLMEAAGIGGFVIIAGIVTIFLEHPSMPVMHSWLALYPLLRRALLGIALGLYVGWTVVLFGKLSGTHVNPSVTAAFYWLGYISFTDTIFYVVAQFTGACIAFFSLKWLVGNLFSYPSINYGLSVPQLPHTATGAFIAEFLISFLLMAATLVCSSSKKLKKYLAVVVGLLIALYITFELPYSGMSMNPARTFAAAFGTQQWKDVWIYFTAPVAAMVLAGVLFRPWQRWYAAQGGKDFEPIVHVPANEAR